MPASGESAARDAARPGAPTRAETASPAKQPSKGKLGDLEPVLTLKAPPDDSPIDPASNPAALATAMLALLGHAPAAAISAAAGGAAKVLAAGVHKGGSPHAVGLSVALTPDGKPSPAHASVSDGGTSAAPTAGEAATAGATGAIDWAQQATTMFGAGSASVVDPALVSATGHKSDRERSLSDLAALLPVGPASTGPAAIVPAHTLQMSSPAGSAAFAQELGQHVSWLGGQDIKHAKIRLHPEELGQLDVKVTVQHTGQVDVTFAAQHPAAVHVVQQTLPQLDALLAQHGLSLGQADVGQRHAGGDGHSGKGFAGSGDASDVGDAVIERPAAVSAIGLLDAFA